MDEVVSKLMPHASVIFKASGRQRRRRLSPSAVLARVVAPLWPVACGIRPGATLDSLEISDDCALCIARAFDEMQSVVPLRLDENTIVFVSATTLQKHLSARSDICFVRADRSNDLPSLWKDKIVITQCVESLRQLLTSVLERAATHREIVRLPVWAQSTATLGLFLGYPVVYAYGSAQQDGAGTVFARNFGTLELDKSSIL
ncbi:MAG: hypothetical protein MHM6MM_004939 [Cercozoa sp. M6MM]